MAFQLDDFIADCYGALKEKERAQAVREVVARAVADRAALTAALGAPERGGIDTLHDADELTVLNVVWAPRMTIMPHNHEMWAVIGVYSGREDNIFWRRVEDAEGGLIEAAGARSLGAREVVPLGRDVIHSVTNPLARATGAIHVYGGRFFRQPRSEWDPESLSERRYDPDKALRLFEAANADSAAA